jgi:hypothetical protein
LQSAAIICIPNPGLKFDIIYYESNQVVLIGPELFQSAHMAHTLKITYIQTYFEDSFELAQIILDSAEQQLGELLTCRSHHTINLQIM